MIAPNDLFEWPNSLNRPVGGSAKYDTQLGGGGGGGAQGAGKRVSALRWNCAREKLERAIISNSHLAATC